LAGTLLPAAPITYIFTGTGSGSLTDANNQSNPFTNAPLTITYTGDTNNVTALNASTSIISTAPGSVSMAIQGLGTFHFSDAGFVFVNRQSLFVGFGTNNLDRFDLGQLAGIGSYDLTTAFGPATTADTCCTFQFINVAMDGGSLTVNTLVPVGTFAAVLGAPEPGTWMLLGSGIAGVLIASRRRLRG